MVLTWFVSLFAVLATGYAAFSAPQRPLPLHGAFMLSVAAFIGCCLWCLSRGLTTMTARNPDQVRRREPGGGEPGRLNYADPDD